MEALGIVGLICLCWGLGGSPDLHRLDDGLGRDTWGAEWIAPAYCASQAAAPICSSTFGSPCTQATLGSECSNCDAGGQTMRTFCAASETEACFQLGTPPATKCGNKFEGTCLYVAGQYICGGTTDTGVACNTGSLVNQCQAS